MATEWHIHGEYVLACNCDYGCPCNFNARPSMGFCQGVVGFQIADGAYGDVRLDGQRAFVAVKWPGAIHEGNGVAAIFIDDSASPPQRDALGKIVSGEAGGRRGRSLPRRGRVSSVRTLRRSNSAWRARTRTSRSTSDSRSPSSPSEIP